MENPLELLKEMPKVLETAKNVLPETMKNADETLAIVPKIIRTFLFPFEAVSLYGKYAIEKIEKSLELKLANISFEKLVALEPYIAIPALQAASYSIDSECLRDLYISLLSKAMHIDYKDSVHPAYIETIKQISPLDAQILKELYKNHEYHHYISFNKQITCFVNLECLTYENYKSVAISINNLERLGLVGLDKTFPKDTDPESVMNKIKDKPKSRKFIDLIDQKTKLYFQEHDWYITDYGEAFCECCVDEFSSASNLNNDVSSSGDAPA